MRPLLSLSALLAAGLVPSAVMVPDVALARFASRAPDTADTTYITVSEGTSMSMATSPDGKGRVFDLQGSL